MKTEIKHAEGLNLRHYKNVAHMLDLSLKELDEYIDPLKKEEIILKLYSALDVLSDIKKGRAKIE
jgi:hypothetical protein